MDRNAFGLYFQRQNMENLHLSLYVFPKHIVSCYYIGTKLINHVSIADYVDALIKKTLHYCTTDKDKPTLPTAPPPLASAYEHPNKDHIPLFSRYKK